jgi:sensor histidine kinase YesM
VVVAGARFTARLRARWVSAAVVMFTPLLIGWLLPALLEPGCRGTIPRLLFLALEGPIVTTALSLQLDRISRRALTARRLLPASFALSAALGAACAYLAWILTVTLGLEFRSFQEGEALTASRVVAFGTVVGVLQFILWALSFAYPFAVEDARLRALETETLRLESERLRLEAETLRLESEKLRSSSELASLRAQLEPHFLLNTLNAIAGLVTQHPREARRLLGCLGDLLRDSLRDVDELQPLAEELSWLRKYAEILESRHAGALTFRWEIEEAARYALLPRLLLQPLVENAINHGALQRSEGGEVRIRARVERSERGRELVCEIEDNGPGLPAHEPRAGAIGLRSVKRRIALKFPDGSFQIDSNAAGTCSRLRLPLRIQAEPPENAPA